MLLAIIAAIASSPTLPADGQARAAVRIERPAVGAADQWKNAAPSARRQIVRADEKGNLIVMRIVDYQ